jgi:hypothetical protein
MKFTQQMTKKVLNQSKVWRFICEYDRKGNWQIFPRSRAGTWKLYIAKDECLLFLGNVPQVFLEQDEVIAFLKHH